MAYNLNYNPGTEYDKHLQRRKRLIILISILVLLVIVVLIWIGWMNRENQKLGNEDNTSAPKLSEEQREQIVRDLQAPPERELTTQERQKIVTDLQKEPPQEQQLTEEQKAKIRADLMR
jgi:cytoskeletal protein RodZ